MTPEQQSKLSEAQAIFVNHSGGKDSQAMAAFLVRMGYGSKQVNKVKVNKYLEEYCG